MLFIEIVILVSYIYHHLPGVGLEDQLTSRIMPAFRQEILVHSFVKQWKPNDPGTSKRAVPYVFFQSSSSHPTTTSRSIYLPFNPGPEGFHNLRRFPRKSTFLGGVVLCTTPFVPQKTWTCDFLVVGKKRIFSQMVVNEW